MSREVGVKLKDLTVRSRNGQILTSEVAESAKKRKNNYYKEEKKQMTDDR